MSESLDSANEKSNDRASKIPDEPVKLENFAVPFEEMAAKTRMPLVFSNPRLHGIPIVYVNDSFLELTGYDRGDVLGHDYHFMIGPCTDPAAHAQIDAAFKEGYGAAYPEVCYHRKDGSTFWAVIFIGSVLDHNGEVAQHFASFLDITRRKQDEVRIKRLLDELDHRVRNTLFTVQTIAQESLSGSAVSEEVRDAFQGRIRALATAHGILTRDGWEGAKLREIVEIGLRCFPLQKDGEKRFTVIGDDIFLEPKAAVALSLLFHELAINSKKYGALSRETGRVGIEWGLDPSSDDERIKLRWQEYGGPPVFPPVKRGFGTKLVERVLPHDLNGEVSLRYATDGVVFEALIPLSRNMLEPTT